MDMRRLGPLRVEIAMSTETLTAAPRMRWQAKVIACVALAVIAAQSYFSWVLASEALQVFAINSAVVLVGMTLGWVFGIFISPLGAEKEEFSRYGKAVSVFFSGYLLAKVDPVVSKVLAAESLFDDLAAFRLLSFVTSFLVAMLIAFGWRKYL